MGAVTKLPLVGDTENQRLIIALEKALNALEESPLAGVVILPQQIIGVTDTRCFHGLGQRVSGYFIVKAPADVRIFDGAVPETINPANFFTLRASSAQLVTIAVF